MTQYGGGLNASKIWDKYGKELILRLKKDRTFKGKLSELPDGFINKDHKRLLEWVVRSYLRGGISRYEDIQSRVYPSLNSYDILLNKRVLSKGNPTEPWTDETNILNFCGLIGCTVEKKKRLIEVPGIDNLIDKYQHHLDAPIIKEIGKSKPFFVGDQVTIYMPTTVDEARYYGRGTKWCTASTASENPFMYYFNQGPLYIVIPNKSHRKRLGEKYQIHVESRSYMDEKDTPVSLSILSDRYPEIFDYDDGIPIPAVYYGTTMVEKDGLTISLLDDWSYAPFITLLTTEWFIIHYDGYYLALDVLSHEMTQIRPAIKPYYTLDDDTYEHIRSLVISTVLDAPGPMMEGYEDEDGDEDEAEKYKNKIIDKLVTAVKEL